MAVSRKMLMVSVYLLCATPALAADTNPGANVRLAKYEDRNPYPQKVRPNVVLEISEKYQYYDIDGKCVQELQHSMKTNGTKWNDGKVYAALTTWDIDYHYKIEKIAGRYSIKSAETDVSIIYRFPRWVPAAPPQQQMTDAWTSYMDNLKVHEFGHKDLAVKAAGEINDMLASLGSFGSKSDLDREAEKVVKSKLREMKDTQVDYDAETHHGETQGALLR